MYIRKDCLMTNAMEGTIDGKIRVGKKKFQKIVREKVQFPRSNIFKTRSR